MSWIDPSDEQPLVGQRGCFFHPCDCMGCFHGEVKHYSNVQGEHYIGWLADYDEDWTSMSSVETTFWMRDPVPPEAYGDWKHIQVTRGPRKVITELLIEEQKPGVFTVTIYDHSSGIPVTYWLYEGDWGLKYYEVPW